MTLGTTPTTAATIPGMTLGTVLDIMDTITTLTTTMTLTTTDVQDGMDQEAISDHTIITISGLKRELKVDTLLDLEFTGTPTMTE